MSCRTVSNNLQTKLIDRTLRRREQMEKQLSFGVQLTNMELFDWWDKYSFQSPLAAHEQSTFSNGLGDLLVIKIGKCAFKSFGVANIDE